MHDLPTTEITPFLSTCEACEGQPSLAPEPTPLPRAQIATLVLAGACEPLSANVIQPFINKLVGELGITGGDDQKVGYYVGLIETFNCAFLTLTILQWNQISDHVGRKPILSIGLFGLILSLLCVGLSRTFWGLVASRCLGGLLDGNIGVTNAIMGEVTDPSNRAQVFALSSITFSVGDAIAPLIGGALSNPHDRFPYLFRGIFWKNYPYFLPCFVAASLIFATLLFTLFFFKETISNAPPTEPGGALYSPEEQPIPIRQLFIYPVLLTIANYTSLEFLNSCHASIFPLFLAMPVELGGLGLDPPLIGYIMSTRAVFMAAWLGLFFSKAIQRFGERRIFAYTMSAYAVSFSLFPLINYCAKSGIWVGVWTGIVTMIVLASIANMAYGCIFIFIVSVTPNNQSLGTVNGLAETIVSIARTIAPIMASSMFSFSVEHQIMGGYGLYPVLLGLSCLGILLALAQPAPKQTTGSKMY